LKREFNVFISVVVIKVPTSITKLCIVSSVDYMLAAGNVNGLIAIFQIPKVHSQAGSDLDFLTKDETPCVSLTGN